MTGLHASSLLPFVPSGTNYDATRRLFADINPPADQPWGREAAFIDLAGVCWHVVKG